MIKHQGDYIEEIFNKGRSLLYKYNTYRIHDLTLGFHSRGWDMEGDETEKRERLVLETDRARGGLGQVDTNILFCYCY